MLVDIDLFDIITLVKNYGYDDVEADILGGYIYDCMNDFELDFNRWISNATFMFFVDEKKDDVIKYLKDKGENLDDCTIYENNQGCLVEFY